MPPRGAIPHHIRKRVRERAGRLCEYCRIEEVQQPVVPHHVEHIIPRKHGGGNEQENLAFACYYCNLHKASNLTRIDPQTNAIVVLFNPRTQTWQEEFAMSGPIVVGLTPCGRATVRVLAMNDRERIDIRSVL